MCFGPANKRGSKPGLSRGGHKLSRVPALPRRQCAFTAAHNPKGKTAFLFEAPAQSAWILIASAHAIEEARRNITAKYPPCEARLKTRLPRLTRVAQPGPSSISIRLPEKDQPIFLEARAARATHLLTDDLKHFGPAMNKPHLSDGIVIQTVAEFLASL
jgi:hypothetical protein